MADHILDTYYPFKLLKSVPFIGNRLESSAETQGSESDGSSQAENIEKWLLIGFCSICILAMIVCIVVLIVEITNCCRVTE